MEYKYNGIDVWCVEQGSSKLKRSLAGFPITLISYKSVLMQYLAALNVSLFHYYFTFGAP